MESTTRVLRILNGNFNLACTVGIVVWTMNIVIFLNFWLMMIWWKYANLEYAEHVKSCHFHQHSSHGLNDSCSLCSRHQQLHLFTRSPESTVTLVLALLRKTLKFIQVLFLVFLILLAGDVETNPGPGKKTLCSGVWQSQVENELYVGKFNALLKSLQIFCVPL